MADIPKVGDYMRVVDLETGRVLCGYVYSVFVGKCCVLVSIYMDGGFETARIK